MCVAMLSPLLIEELCRKCKCHEPAPCRSFSECWSSCSKADGNNAIPPMKLIPLRYALWPGTSSRISFEAMCSA
ncbi:hypothetical protein TanjilG_20663 [Lupinus angustifolius]|uniref:Uncharacterized protein n=1 Tax=Lupinus angustifolius TaxID=3871 RepID=A0A4P1QRG9_LUPAN|nr:hypothetical protein TanjilG_20663 [Lupinus angustifolius]